MTIAISVTKEGDWDVLSYAGPINEEAEVHLAPIAGGLGNRVRINFKDVTMVNSCGVRSWVNFMRQLDQRRSIVFQECTSEIVMQINMIPSFQGSASIESVYAAYTCDDCDSQSRVLFVAGDNLPQSFEEVVDAPQCGNCGNQMEMDELEEEFFAFVGAA